MTSNSDKRRGSQAFRGISFAALCFAVVSCASAPAGLKSEPGGVAARLGYAGCTISVPLSRAEVVENSKLSGNPNPEENNEWMAMATAIRPGDQIRLVNCLGSNKVGDQYYYGLFRGGTVIARFHPMIFN